MRRSTLTVSAGLAMLLLAALQGRAAQRLRGAAAAAGDGGRTAGAHGDRLYRAHRHDGGGAHGPAGGPGRGLPASRSISRTASGSRRATCCSPSSRTQYQAQLQQAQSAGRCRPGPAGAGPDRVRPLFGPVQAEGGLGGRRRHLARQSRRAQADLLGAQAKVELAQINLGYTTVTAPFDGRMGRHLVDAGNLVGIGGSATVLAEINRIDPIYAYFTINERELLRIRAQRARAAPASPTTRCWSWAPPTTRASPYQGKLDFAAITLTAGTGTLQLRGIFPNPDYRLLPGLFVRIRAPLGRDAGRAPGPRRR